MLAALIFAVLSAVCMALMVTTDRLMVGDCYRGKPNHAWFVSSLAGSIFGLLLTAIIWFGGSEFADIPNAHTLFVTAQELFVWKGLAALLIGAIGIQMLLHYFRCFGEEAHSSVVAAWIAATPVFVFMGAFLLEEMFGVASGLTLSGPVWLIGVLLATGGLVCLERLTGGPKGNVKVYRRELVMLLVISVAYTIGLKHVFTFESTDALTEAVALMPFYWLGFGAGTRVMLKKRERESFSSNLRKRIRYFLVPIFFLEIIGMLVFFFEYLALTQLDPTTTSLILGAHVLLVYILDVLLGHFRGHMENRGLRKAYIAGIRLVKEKLPEPRTNSRTVVLEILMVTSVIVGIAIVTAHMG
jgi:Ca2+/Na+ antiporter